MHSIIRTVIIYFVVLLAVRLMGKRELAQLSPFDFVVAIIIAELAALPMEQTDIPLWEVFIPLGVLVILEIGLSFIALKSERARGWIYGFPTLVIIKGKIMDNNMRKLRYNTDDLLAQLRDKGIFEVSDVEYAIMEVPGSLSIMPKSQKRPLTPDDLNLKPPDEAELPVPVVLDGVIKQKNLDMLNISRQAIENELSKHDLQVHQVFLATYSTIKGVQIISKKGEQMPSRLTHLGR